MISSVLTLLLASTMNLQISNTGLRSEGVADTAKFMIVDTVDFEGLMILDFVNAEEYFIQSAGLKKIHLKYRSNNCFKKDFEDQEKMSFLDPIAFKDFLLKYQGIELPDDLYWIHNPVRNGNLVYKASNNAEIHISLFRGCLVRTKMSLNLAKEQHMLYIDDAQGADYVYFYSFL